MLKIKLPEPEMNQKYIRKRKHRFFSIFLLKKEALRNVYVFRYRKIYEKYIEF